MKVALLPELASFPDTSGGVRRVIEALCEHLPKYVELVVPQDADVIHCHAAAMNTVPKPMLYTNHGIMPLPLSDIDRECNEVVFRNLVTADAVTCVSKWAPGAYRRMGRKVLHIPNGVNLGKVGNPADYVLFGKVCNGGVAEEGAKLALALASRCPTIPFVFVGVPEGATVPPNVRVLGPQPYDKMRRWLDRAYILLATTLECFSVQVLEAMSLGIPVVGMNWGGTAEVVGEGGILVDDRTDLEKALRTVGQKRKAYGKTAREIIAAGYQWKDIVPRYVAAYEDVLRKSRTGGPKVSIVITCYNKEKYIAEAIESALAQTYQDREIIVVDDKSTDGSAAIIKRYRGKLRGLNPKQATGGAGPSRNYGVEMAKGEYVVCLDGDDRLHEDFLEKLVPLLERDKACGIAYGNFRVIGGGEVVCHDWDISRLRQGNYIGNASLFRKVAWERVGGYRNINPSWEDYNFWLSIAKAGFYGAHHNEALWSYRMNLEEGRNADSQGQEPRLRATVNAYHPEVFSPLVSVVIPCYNHEKYLEQAVDSVLAQTFHDYEIIVVNDGSPGDTLKALTKYVDEPRVRYLKQKNTGLAGARNAGVCAARGKYILPLDADDMLAPEFLMRALEEMRKGDGIIYSDFVAFRDDGSTSKHVQPEYNFSEMLERGMMFATSLYPKAMWEEVGGYDEDFHIGWEDYAFWIAAGAYGWQGRKIPYFGFRYRQHDKSMRTEAEKRTKELRAELAKKFMPIYQAHGRSHGLRGM